MEKKLYDGKYWFKKADALVKEKKKQLDDNNQARQQLKIMQDENKNLKDKIKHLT